MAVYALRNNTCPAETFLCTTHGTNIDKKVKDASDKELAEVILALPPAERERVARAIYAADGDPAEAEKADAQKGVEEKEEEERQKQQQEQLQQHHQHCAPPEEATTSTEKAGEAEADAGIPLAQAAEEGKVDLVRDWISKKGSDGVNERGGDGFTPLANAVCLGHLEIVQILLAARAAVDEKSPPPPDLGANTALVDASTRENVEILTALLEAGASTSVTCGYAKHFSEVTALVAACLESRTECIKALLSAGADPSHQFRMLGPGNTFPLNFAVSSGNTGMVKILVEGRADLESRGSGGSSPLNESSARWQDRVPIDARIEITGLLIAARADVNSQDKNSRTPLDHATSVYRNLGVTVVEMLLRANATVTPYSLHSAARYGRLEQLRLLLEARGDINAKSDYNWNALMYAAASEDGGTAKVIKFLLEARSDVSGTTKEQGRSALGLLAGGTGGREYVGAPGAPGAAIDLLVGARADVNERDKENMTPLMQACALSSARFASHLIELRADANCVDDGSQTALHHLAIFCKDEMLDVAKLLVNSKADLAAKNSKDQTPLDVAKSSPWESSAKPDYVALLSE